jgi:hypothetical protein
MTMMEALTVAVRREIGRYTDTPAPEGDGCDQPCDPMGDYYDAHIDEDGKVYYTEKDNSFRAAVRDFLRVGPTARTWEEYCRARAKVLELMGDEDE